MKAKYPEYKGLNLPNVAASVLEKWQKEQEALRSIVLDCGLSEELKWGVPTYTFQKTNIVIIGGFKEYDNC